MACMQSIKECQDYRLLLSTWLKYLPDEALDSSATLLAGWVMQLLVGYVLLCCSLIFSKVLRNKGASQVALVVKKLPASAGNTGDMG